MPDGKLSVTPTPLLALGEASGLVISIRRVAGVPPLMLFGANDLLIPRATFALVSTAATAAVLVGPSAVVMPPTGKVKFCAPPAVVVMAKDSAQLVPAASVAPVSETDVAPGV